MKIGTSENATTGNSWLRPLRRLENPFLIREIRQLARSPRPVQVALLGCLGAMGLVLIGWLLLAQQGYRTLPFGPRGASLEQVMGWLMMLFHTLLCGIMAGYGSYRLFASEQLRSTFELTQLLPYPPLRWLLLKLGYPALGVLVAWMAGYPFYSIALLSGLIEPWPGHLFFLMHKPLLAGVGVMLFALLATPEYIRRAQQRQAKVRGMVTGQRIDTDIELEMWSMTFGLYTYVLLAGLFLTWGLTATPLPFYRTHIPTALYWGIGLVLFAIPAFLTGYTALVPQERLEVRAHRVRVVSLVIGFYVYMGLIWAGIPLWWYRLGILCIPLVRAIFVFATRSKREKAKATERPTNTQSEREVQWLMPRFPNALLMRDLRVYSRVYSMRQCFLWSLGFVMLFPLGWLGVVLYGVPVAMARVLRQMVPQLALQMFIALTAGAWGRPSMQWHKERTAKTLPLLLITPMSSREMLLGRLVAGPIYQIGGQFPLMLLVVFGLGWALYNGFWMVGPVVLALMPLSPGLGIWTGCQPAGQMLKLQGLREWGLAAALTMGHLLLLAWMGYSLFLAFEIGTKVGVGPPLYWGMGLLQGVGQGLLLWAWFEFRVRQLDRFRQSDMEVLDTKELKPLKRRQLRRLRRASGTPAGAVEG